MENKLGFTDNFSSFESPSADKIKVSIFRFVMRD